VDEDLRIRIRVRHVAGGGLEEDPGGHGLGVGGNGPRAAAQGDADVEGALRARALGVDPDRERLRAPVVPRGVHGDARHRGPTVAQVAEAVGGVALEVPARDLAVGGAAALEVARVAGEPAVAAAAGRRPGPDDGRLGADVAARHAVVGIAAQVLTAVRAHRLAGETGVAVRSGGVARRRASHHRGHARRDGVAGGVRRPDAGGARLGRPAQRPDRLVAAVHADRRARRARGLADLAGIRRRAGDAGGTGHAAARVTDLVRSAAGPVADQRPGVHAGGAARRADLRSGVARVAGRAGDAGRARDAAAVLADLVAAARRAVRDVSRLRADGGARHTRVHAGLAFVRRLAARARDAVDARAGRVAYLVRAAGRPGDQVPARVGAGD